MECLEVRSDRIQRGFPSEREGKVIQSRSTVLEKWNVLRLDLTESREGFRRRGKVSHSQQVNCFGKMECLEVRSDRIQRGFPSEREDQSFTAGQLFWKNGMS